MPDTERITVVHLQQMKIRRELIAALTAHDFPTASAADEMGVDLILVGDSLGMVFAGDPSTVSVTLDQMLYHTRIVARHVRRALVVADLPFLSYQVNPDEAVRNGGRLLQEAGAHAVKLEGGEEWAEVVRRLVTAGIPVVGHIGVTPQSVNRTGGYKLRGATDAEAARLKQDARALEEAGAFALVLEKIPYVLAEDITLNLRIPTIGIGAGPGCDGQILVTYDMLSMFERFRPRFVRLYAELGREMREAMKRYVEDVKSERFPSLKESFK